MPGDAFELEGGARSLLSAVIRLAEHDFALIGGLAVMIRLDRAHRVTLDLDGVFDNPGDVPTTAALVASGIATGSPAPQRVVVMGTDVDVIDTFPLPGAEHLPDDAKGRLFVCAHRYAFEAATPLRLGDGTTTAVVRVASPPALIATKAHALRFGSPRRRATKRSSDVHDVYRLASAHLDAIVDGLRSAPWELGAQVAAALDEDLRDVEQVLAVLRRSAGLASIDEDDVTDVLTDLLAALGDLHAG